MEARAVGGMIDTMRVMRPYRRPYRPIPEPPRPGSRERLSRHRPLQGTMTYSPTQGVSAPSPRRAVIPDRRGLQVPGLSPAATWSRLSRYPGRGCGKDGADTIHRRAMPKPGCAHVKPSGRQIVARDPDGHRRTRPLHRVRRTSTSGERGALPVTRFVQQSRTMQLCSQR